MDILNSFTLKRIHYNNLCTNKAEAALGRTNYHYYEQGNKTGKLLAWQIRKEESDRIIHSVTTDDGRSLVSPSEINVELKKFYETLYKQDHNTSNIATEQFLEDLPLPQITAEDKTQLDADITEAEVLLAMKSLQNNKASGPDGFPIEYFKTFSDKLLSLLTNMMKEALNSQTLPGFLELATITATKT